MREPYGWRDPRAILTHHERRPSRRYSQNFLIDPNIVRRIAEEVSSFGSAAIELGPGAGTLTTALLDRDISVWAIERDPKMLEILRKELQGDARVRLIEGDAAQVDLSALCREAATDCKPTIVGNLPYAITGAILRNLVNHATQIENAVIMVQTEVYQRMIAEPSSKSYGPLTIFTQNVFAPRRVIHVPKNAFFPAPKIRSTVVHLRRRAAPRALVDRHFEDLVHAAFQQRRKQLRNSLGSVLDDPATALSAIDLDPSARAETLSIEDFGRLAEHTRRANRSNA